MKKLSMLVVLWLVLLIAMVGCGVLIASPHRQALHSQVKDFGSQHTSYQQKPTITLGATHLQIVKR